jgi:hypothetical protein
LVLDTNSEITYKLRAGQGHKRVSIWPWIQIARSHHILTESGTRPREGQHWVLDPNSESMYFLRAE